MFLILQGNASAIPLKDRSVHCVITSPPYWGLRDYGTAKWDGGDEECDHRMKNPEVDQRTSTLGHNGNGLEIDNAAYQHGKVFKDSCRKCGATRIDNQIGLEKTPEEYVEHLVQVFREVKRVLRDDGTLWLNLGDSYCSTAPGTNGDPLHVRGILAGVRRKTAEARRKYRPNTPAGLKPKDLVGIPWRVALALQRDGWYLRSDIIWSKPNAMPESVTDRPSKAHEYIFLLTKSRKYFFDNEAVKELAINDRKRGAHSRSHVPGGGDNSGLSHGEFEWRNIRSVWEMTTSGFADAHFATFPLELPERCIKAGTSEKGCCAKCGAPLRRIVETLSTVAVPRGSVPSSHRANVNKQPQQAGITSRSRTVGWKPTCKCNADLAKCIVLDPFSGAGTTCLVALRLGRSAVGIELSAEYAAMAQDRIYGDSPLSIWYEKAIGESRR